MKERLKMIFDRIDILVVCIILGTCVCIAEAFLGFWNIFADCFIMTFLVSEVCYTLRCNEKLKKELIEANWKLKDTESELESAHLEIAKKEQARKLLYTTDEAVAGKMEMRTRQGQLLQAQDNIETTC